MNGNDFTTTRLFTEEEEMEGDEEGAGVLSEWETYEERDRSPVLSYSPASPLLSSRQSGSPIFSTSSWPFVKNIVLFVASTDVEIAVGMEGWFYLLLVRL